MKRYNVAVVGVGAVGIEMLRCLKKRNFPVGKLRVLARSSREIEVGSHKYEVQAITPDAFSGVEIALFAGTEGEKGAAVTFAPEAIKRGAVVIDNGADFRMDPGVPLIVPEVNPQDINPVKNWLRGKGKKISNGSEKHKGIIANPNCSTIQMVVALWPIYRKAGLRRIIVSSYQAVSGAGRGGVAQLESELKGEPVSQKAFNYPIAGNVIPHIGGFAEFDYTSEEWKMVHETHKIMHDSRIKISATCVRVPVISGHSEAIYIETRKAISLQAVRNLLSVAKGVKVVDAPQDNLYPLAIDSVGRDEVFLGRIRRDPFVKNGLWLWVVSDNLLKGAALNAVQIAELLCSS